MNFQQILAMFRPTFFFNFLHFPNAKGVAAVFLLVLCICCACSLSVRRDAIPESDGFLLRAFIELFEDKNQVTRMEAYFISVGLPDMPELEQILRQRQNNSDQLEQIIASYALAVMTRDHQDINAFLDVFPDEPQLFTDLMETEWALSGTFNTGMADFLLLLAYEPRTREKALPHLARIICNMPGELESMGQYFKDPLVHAYIDKHWQDARRDDILNADPVRAFNRTERCEEKLAFLIQHGDMASKITAMLMTRRIWIPDNLMKIIRNFQELPHDSIYNQLLNLDFNVEFLGNMLLMAPNNTLPNLLDAEKKLYRPPLKGIVGTLLHRLSFDDKNSAQILKILEAIRQYGIDWLEVCEIHRINLL